LDYDLVGQATKNLTLPKIDNNAPQVPQKGGQRRSLQVL
jgi:hypothetical protein